jgi:hypothetical protein
MPMIPLADVNAEPLGWSAQFNGWPLKIPTERRYCRAMRRTPR